MNVRTNKRKNHDHELFYAVLCILHLMSVVIVEMFNEHIQREIFIEHIDIDHRNIMAVK